LDRLAAAGKSALSAVYFAGVGSGIAISAILVSLVSIGESNWRDLWLVSGVAAIVCTLLVFWLVPKERVVEQSTDQPTESGMDARLKYFIVAYGLFGFGYVITATFISDLVRNSTSLQPVEPFIWLAFGIGAIPSVWFWTAIGRKWDNGLSFAIALAVEAIAVALSVLSDNPVLVVIAAMLLGATFMGITALGFINARQLSRGDPRRMFALMTAAFGFGQMIGPSFAGYIFDISGSYLAPSMIAAGGLVIAAMLALRTRRQ
jgi:predicted MFS family arabinose efflux permease